MPDRDALERLSKKLNSGTSTDGIRRSHLSPKGSPAPSAWHDEPTAPTDTSIAMSRKRRTSTLEIIFIGSILFFVAAVAAASLLFYSGSNTVSTKNVDVQVSGPASIAAGETLSLQVVVTNRNTVPIQLADLVVTFPPGTRSDINISVSVPRTRISLGTINPGESVNRTVKAVLFGAASTDWPMQASLEYRVQSSNAVFVSESTYTAHISQSPAAITVVAGKEVVSGQSTAFTVTLKSNSPQVLKDMLLVVTYPPGFVFQDATPAASSGNAVWNLGDVEPGGTRVITIHGIFAGEDGEARTLTFTAGNKKRDSTTEIAAPLATAEANLTVTKPFISAAIAIGGSVAGQHTILRGIEVPAQVQWTNNLPVAVQNLSIQLKINGQILNKSSVHLQSGFFSSSDSSVLWDRTTNPDFANVAPGASGILTFSFATLPVTAGNFKNPQLDFTVNVTANRQSEGNVPEVISSTATTKAVVATNLGLTASLSHAGNTGPLPPKADTETVYTVSWNVSNSANALANAVVTGALPSYVKFIGGVSPAGATVTFDKNKSIVTWSVGNLAANESKNVSFQIGFTPSVSQVGDAPVLVSSQKATGFDRFVQDSVEITANPLTTSSGAGINQDHVVQ